MSRGKRPSPASASITRAQRRSALPRRPLAAERIECSPRTLGIRAARAEAELTGSREDRLADQSPSRLRSDTMLKRKAPGANVMAKGYWVALVEVSEPDGYKAYIAENAKPLRKFGGRFLAEAGSRRRRKARPGRPRLAVRPVQRTGDRAPRSAWATGRGST